MMFKGLVLTFSRLSKWLCTGFLSYSISKTGSSASAAKRKNQRKKMKYSKNNHLILNRIVRNSGQKTYPTFPMSLHLCTFYKTENLIRVGLRNPQDWSLYLLPLWKPRTHMLHKVAPVTHRLTESTRLSPSPQSKPQDTKQDILPL